MPELPDITLYIESLKPRIVGEPLEKLRIFNPFVVRSFEPPIQSLVGKQVTGLTRIGKRIALDFEDDLHLVIHLMIAGRFRWSENKKDFKPGNKMIHATFDFPKGMLTLTEASTHKRASMTLVQGKEKLKELDPGGIDVFKCSAKLFTEKLIAENRTLKRALTNPRAFDGIGNAYSDEILHAAKLSPLRLTQSLNEEEIERLLGASRKTLSHWTEKLLAEFAGKFPGPGDVTAFRPDFAVHGKFGEPCPTCGKPVQRIRYAENETNYCARCQNEDRILADRSLSRLLKDDWPKTLEEMEGA